MKISTDTSKLKFHVLQDDHYVDLNLYQFGWEKCKPLHSFGPYIRNHYLFHYILNGKGRLLAGEEYELSAGSGFLISPKQITTYIADKEQPWEYVWLEFDGLGVASALQQAGLGLSSPILQPKNKETGKALAAQMMKIVDAKQSSTLHLIGQGFLFLDLLVKTSGMENTASDRKLRDFYIKEALSFIEQNYQNPITIEEIAAACGLNRSYFGRVFREVMGASPQQFLIHYRIAKSQQYLRNSNLSIAEISNKVGYENPLHFSRAFKEKNGLSPREYRQKNYVGNIENI